MNTSRRVCVRGMSPTVIAAASRDAKCYEKVNREGCWGTTDDFATSFLHFSLFSTALWDLPNSRPVYSRCSLRLFTIVRRSSCGLIACWILARTSSLVTWSLYELCSILRYLFTSMACILLWSSAVRVHDSQVYRKMYVTWERISRILELHDDFITFL